MHMSSQVREFANELRAESKTSTGSGQNVNSADSSTVSDAYSKMLTVFIPLMVDEVKVLNIFS